MAEGRQECFSCGILIRPNARFCHDCGVPVWPLKNCEYCGEPTPSNGFFCDQCGESFDGVAKVGQAAKVAQISGAVEVEPAPAERGSELTRGQEEEPPPSLIDLIIPGQERRNTERGEGGDSERRVVTVMFADISGFTSISENLEPEDVSEIMNTVFDSMTDIIVEHGGTIDKYIGDCVMALFGAPRSYGDDAERAARAALAMQAAIGALADRFESLIGARLQMRVGLNTGMVMAGYVGGQGHQNYTVMGDAVNVASRMEAACESGRILVASNTRRAIAERFVVSDAGRFDVKGKSEPVDAYHVERERTGEVADMGTFFEGVPVPFVGRQEQIAAMEVAFSKTQENQCAHVVKLTGPVGAGKSRMLSEFSRRRLAEEPGTVLVYGRATRSTGGLMEPLRQGIVGVLKQRWGSVQEALPFIFEHDDEEADERVEEERVLEVNIMELIDVYLAGGEVFLGSGEQSKSVRRTLFWGLAQLLAKLGDQGVVLMVISDAHLADQGLVDFVSFLTASIAPPVPILVLWEMQTNPDTHQKARRLFEGDRTGMVQL